MLQLKKLLLITLTLGFTQSMLYSFAQIQEPVLTKANSETLVISITSSNFTSLTNDGVENLGLVQVGSENNLIDINLGAKKVSASGSINLVLATKEGVIYNTSPLPGSVSIVNIKQSTGQGTILYLGSSSRLVNSVTNDLTVSGTSMGKNNGQDQIYNIPDASTINYSYFALKADGGQANTITELKFTMIVSQVVVQNAATFNFSVEFVLGTNNKKDFCTAEDLNWSFWQSEFNKLSIAQQEAFRTDSTDSDIIAARERYLYLRSFNPNLVNFAGI